MKPTTSNLDKNKGAFFHPASNPPPGLHACASTAVTSGAPAPALRALLLPGRAVRLSLPLRLSPGPLLTGTETPISLPTAHNQLHLQPVPELQILVTNGLWATSPRSPVSM